MLDLRRLRLLRELDARGTVHAAARALDYTPSAVSQQLAVLEREAGATLLERTGRTLRLTDAGRLLVEHAGALLDRMEAAEADVAALVAGRPAGTVQIAAFQTAFLQLVAPAVARLAAEHPDVRVEAAEIEVEEAVALLRLGHLDVVVGDEYEGVPRPVWPDLARGPLLTEQVRVMLPDHALAAGAWPRPARGRRLGRLALEHRPPRDAAARLPGARRLRARHPLPLRRPRDPARDGAHDGRRRAAARPRARRVAASPPRVAGGGIGREVFTLTRRARTPAVEVVLDALSASRTDRRAAGVAGARAAQQEDDPDGDEQRRDEAPARGVLTGDRVDDQAADEGAGQADADREPDRHRVASGTARRASAPMMSP